MIYRLLLPLLILTSCSEIAQRRGPASASDPSCRSLANSILENREDILEGWSTKRIAKIFDNQRDLETFYRYVDRAYPQVLREKIGGLARSINNFHQQRIYTNFFVQLEMAKRAPKASFPPPSKNWTNKTWAYVYVDKFGVQVNGEHATFDNFIQNLDYYKDKLKVSNLYLLPINKSPKLDGGYDVASYQSIDELIGGNAGFKRFITAARNQDLNVMVDFVPGHTSKEHPWFQKALQGEKKYQEYYLNSPTDKPGELLREGGNVYKIYKTENGEEYKRLLLFPDLETKHWHKENLAGDNSHYFYSSFYPFQKDLNLQNPDVLGEHLNTLGWWINQGVNGIRADAISWWVKKEGTSGQHLDETLAVSEYFNTFLKYLNKDSMFLPELVDAPETAVRYLGKTANINGSIGGSNSNAVFDFEKSVQIFYAGISGNFTDHYKFLKRTRNLSYPENTQTILYSANHHDEIYLGFLSDSAKSDFQNKIKRAGGIVYKEGNSGGAMLADLLKGDHHQMFHFYKFLFGHKGAVAIYQGAALGLKNAWKETHLTTFKQLDEMVASGRLERSHPVFAEIARLLQNPDQMKLPPHEGSPLLPFIDGRLLHRNKLSQEILDQAKNGDNEFFNSFSKLPTLKEGSPALNGNGVEEPLDSLRSDIGSFMRRSYHIDGSLEQEVAVIKNGTEQPTEVKISRQQLTGKRDFSLREIELNSPYSYRLEDNDQSVVISLEPFQTLWLEVNGTY